MKPEDHAPIGPGVPDGELSPADSGASGRDLLSTDDALTCRKDLRHASSDDVSTSQHAATDDRAASASAPLHRAESTADPHNTAGLRATSAARRESSQGTASTASHPDAISEYRTGPT